MGKKKMLLLKRVGLIILSLILLVFIFYTILDIMQVTVINGPGILAVRDPKNIYAKANAGMLTDRVKGDLYRVYVPNSFENNISVINSKTYTVIGKYVTGKNPQHVVPSYDLRTLWVLNDLANTLTPIDPKTGKPGKNVPVYDPYNLYYTPDGRFAIVVVEAGKRLDFRDAHSMKLVESIPVHCNGINHMDFTADGRFAIVTCEFSGHLMKFDVNARKVLGYLSLKECFGKNMVKHSMPQDVRLSPDGRIFYVADMMMDGVFLIDPDTFKAIGFIKTGRGAHGIYPSRDGKYFYVANRGCHSPSKCMPHGPGSVTVIDPKRQHVVARWPIPGGGSPDMGNISADGKELWLSGRYDHEVYVFNTQTGQLMHRIRVGGGPHGLTVWPQPGNYSLGHTGNMR